MAKTCSQAKANKQTAPQKGAVPAPEAMTSNSRKARSMAAHARGYFRHKMPK